MGPQTPKPSRAHLGRGPDGRFKCCTGGRNKENKKAGTTKPVTAINLTVVLFGNRDLEPPLTLRPALALQGFSALNLSPKTHAIRWLVLAVRIWSAAPSAHSIPCPFLWVDWTGTGTVGPGLLSLPCAFRPSALPRQLRTLAGVPCEPATLLKFDINTHVYSSFRHHRRL